MIVLLQQNRLSAFHEILQTQGDVRKRTVQSQVEANEQCDLTGNLLSTYVLVCVGVWVCVLYSVVYNSDTSKPPHTTLKKEKP